MIKNLPILILSLGCIGISSGFQVLAFLMFLFLHIKNKINYNFTKFFKTGFVQKSLFFIFLWILCVIISDLVYKESISGFKDGWNYLQRMLPFFLIGLFYYYEKKNLKYAWLGICICLSLINIDVFYNIILQEKWRPITMFGNPNRLGGFLIMLLPFVMYGTYRFRSEKPYMLFGMIVLISGMFALFAAGSRGAILGLIGGILITLMLLKFKKKEYLIFLKTLFVGVIFVAIIISCAYYLYPELVHRSYDVERIYLWKSAIEMLNDYPIWGVGTGNFNNIYVNSGYINVLAKEPDLQHPHNIFLFYFVERGIFVGITFILMLLSQIYILFKNLLLINNKINFTVLAEIIVIIGAIIHGCVDAVMDNRTYQLMYWFLYGMACYSIVLDKDDKDSV